MRTTVSLDRDIEQILRETALRTHRSFKRVLNETLRNGIAASTPAEKQEAKPKRFVVKAHSMHLRPGIDLRKVNELIGDLEVEAYLETTRKLEAYIAAKKRKK